MSPDLLTPGVEDLPRMGFHEEKPLSMYAAWEADGQAVPPPSKARRHPHLLALRPCSSGWRLPVRRILGGR